ncbi:MAG: SMC-Scp complex subunit ScpB [Spirochaetes bacterium]|nr:MAG: SMC-Scp complex subunit ScpB [Spirochaetota bacterium]
MDLNNETALIDAILFLEAEPVESKTLSRISGLSVDVVLACLDRIKEKYDQEDHGVELIEISEGFLLSPKKELWEKLKWRYGKRKEARLSRAALETLSIIAYSQPITKSEIENIRGVSADGMIRLLLEKNFIKEVGRKDVPGKPVQYGTTKDFLKIFRLRSIADLPKLEDIEKERFELNG